MHDRVDGPSAKVTNDSKIETGKDRVDEQLDAHSDRICSSIEYGQGFTKNVFNQVRVGLDHLEMGTGKCSEKHMDKPKLNEEQAKGCGGNSEHAVHLQLLGRGKFVQFAYVGRDQKKQYLMFCCSTTIFFYFLKLKR